MRKFREALFHRLRTLVRDVQWDAVRQLQLALILLVGTVVVGIVGYRLIEGMSWIDSTYMTTITLTTVGFGEVTPLSVWGRMFTIALLAVGLTLVAYATRGVIEILLTQKWWHSLGERRMKERLDRMTDHYIVCGYGRVGQEIAQEFVRRNLDFVIVDADIEIRQELIEADIPYVLSDATHDDALIQAGVTRAKGLLAVVNGDAKNVLISLSAKELNPDIIVVARASSDEMVSKLHRAGADHVTSPYVIGGQRMAFALVRPAVYSFLETVVYSEELNIEMGQISVLPGSPLAGKTLGESNLRERWAASIVGIVLEKGETLISPAPTHRIAEGDTLIVVVPSENLPDVEALGRRG